MIKRIKEYLEYRKNKKAAQKAFAKLAASTLPVLSAKSADIISFVVRIAGMSKDANGEKLIEMVLSEVSKTLQSDNKHIIEILTYMAALKPEDIRKILIHSTVETMPDNTNSSI